MEDRIVGYMIFHMFSMGHAMENPNLGMKVFNHINSSILI